MPRLTQLSRSIEGLVAIVTGAASGMGRATAHLFADEGAKVVVTDLGEARVQAVVDEIAHAHGADSVKGVVCDVADPEQLRALVGSTITTFGTIDIVVNNAGVALSTSLLDGDEDGFESNWATTLDVNLT